MPGTVNEAGTMEAAQSNPLNEDVDEDGGIRIGNIYIPPPPLPCLSFDPTGPRLMISEIVIENFKSYGGKVALGPFQKNFSAIVGPNGSGKSNVIDSMLFVFGYRAQKIRSQTVGVLIHSSDTYPNLTSCSVNVHFQKIIDKTGDDYDVVPNSQFVISRTAYKDNSSFYCIDNRKVPFKEVSRLLRSYGIDLDHNRFLILQGEVEQISLMKPKSPNVHDTGMLEFLEDIIGSGRFKEPIELLLKNVEELNELRTEKLNRVKGVEKEKDDLEGPMNEAMAYINTKNKLIVKKHILNQCYRYEATIKLKAEIEKKTTIEIEQGDFLKRFEQVEQGLAEAEKEKVSTSKTYGKLCKRYEDQQKKINDLEILDMKRREELKHTNTRNKELIKALEQEKRKITDLESAPMKLEEEIKDMQEKLDGELARRKMDCDENEQKVMASLHTETKELRADKDKQEEKLMHLQKSVDEAQSKLGIAQVELDLYVRNGQNEENRLREMQAANERNMATRTEMESEIKALGMQLPQEQERLSADVSELENVMRKENEMIELLTTQKIKFGEMTTAMQNSHNRGRVLEALMREKAEGRIGGIIGRLGDLGAIEERYDIAISTACRPLDNIVTDTLTSAEACVAFLKRNNLGQATFIALDKMQGWNEHIRKRFEPPAGVRRLFDLIQVKDENILPAFYFALRDTLVAKDIDEATAIGLQGRVRHRVVTLKGELIETSGTMSGGGNRPMRGRMGTSIVGDTITMEQVEAARREVDGLQRIVDELVPKKLELQERVTEFEKRVQQIKHSLQKREMELEAITEELRVLRGQLKEQVKRVEMTIPDEKRTKELTENLKKEKIAFDKADEAAKRVKTIIQGLHDKINEISGNKLNKAQELVRKVDKEIDDLAGASNKKKVAIKTARRNYVKSQEKIAGMQTEIEENAIKLDDLKKALKELEGIAIEAIRLQKELMEEKKAVENGLSVINARIEELSTELQEYKSKKMDIDHELKQLADAISKRENKISHWTRELTKMSLEDVEGAEQLELKELSEEELRDLDVKEYGYSLIPLEENLKNAKPNLAAIAEYYRKEKLYLQRVDEMDMITKQRDAQRARHDNLRKQRLNEFMKGFGIISQKLKETYQMLTLGGDAELELVNSLDPFSDGIVFSVRPPRKSWKNISNLSGGEKTLSSLALVFALHYYKPTPFYVMDEIDAALDFRNVTIVGHYIKEQTKNAQFIVISLRNNMFELADRLVGVYKTYNTSHSMAYDPRSASRANAEGTHPDTAAKMPDAPQR